ncbi:7,8-dihydropterin-6-methyl-4-(beta-D-ribofuranosyl)-aminobenzene-5'-phosphate synthase [Psilocybe cubensis]|uniref:Metallo-beta-lactamase domain-containing protein n=2 Tax=Psilocybe cubensis TaxID=181762 RepID=A0A8H8CP22_PSICU|nr:7,8-dihydropterin-6-methyl-4-(beta-D-ribofuranosyl)-aminobenzene-5'-phosphate synthase [Psilocybe cubensis]KAH9485004.1 7,8-dihydropterin-6-methyl-4-(beta-D-ribofuranosyl)-aminobenzene-5'-phosphate synthase [Psilocybe cubensis]
MPPQVKQVDKLTIIFLVDNCIEWMTKLPPGFSHELPQHLQQTSHGVFDKEKGVPVLDFDNFCCGAHGFSALIETSVTGEESSRLTLFDTGPDSLSLVRNIKAMEVPVHRIERVITSHWHSDHTGGLLSFLALKKDIDGGLHKRPCIVDVHPSRPIARGIAPGPGYDKVICALPLDPTIESIQTAGGIVEPHSEGHAVADGAIWVSGEIPRVTDFETGILGGHRWMKESTDNGHGGKWVNEPHIMDERYAAIDVAGKGLVIFSACSHAGIVNVVKDAVETFNRPIYMIIGGLHLAGPEFSPRIPKTVNFLSNSLRPSPMYILPMHCSGFQSKIALEKSFGEGCVPGGVGLKVEVVGDREHDGRLFPPTIV